MGPTHPETPANASENPAAAGDRGGSEAPVPLPAERLRRLPALCVPILYFAFAHLSLASAFAALALEPYHVASSIHHSYTLAVVHLITLGWITSSILGALYLVMPMAMGSPMPSGRLDVVAFLCYAAGVSGMAAHFWLAMLPGMAWSAGLAALAALLVLVRAWRAVIASKAPAAVKLHFYLAFVNFVLAAGAGLAIGFERISPYLSLGIVPLIYAHAQFAVLGWATMMVMAAGYRLLPMLLPASMPGGRAVFASAVLLQVGSLGLFVSLAIQSAWSAVFAAACGLAIATFLSRVRWMARHRKPPPVDLPRPDLGVRQVFQALFYLAASVVLGLVLALTPPALWKMPAAAAYGACGLVGFVSQIVVGISARLLPMFAWLRGYAGSAYRHRPPPPHAMPARKLQAAVSLLWTLGVPLLVAGSALVDGNLVRSAGVVLFAAVALGMAGNIRILRYAFR